MSGAWRVTGGVALAIASLGCATQRSTTTPPITGIGAVDVHWDEWQVPHVFAETRAGVAYGLGWAQLRAYPNEILDLYAYARGESAAIHGREALASDKLMRTLGIPRLAEAAFDRIDGETRAELEAFAKGMNDFAAKHPERFSEAARAVLPVRPTDMLAHGHRVLLAFTLLTGQRPLLLGIDGSVLPSVAGSNAWAIGPSRSASGHPLLLANPHLPWDMPAARLFEAHMVGPDAPLYGCALLGFPGISIGFNDAIAWTHTVNVIDTADFFVLVPDGDGYRLDDKRRSFEVHSERVKVKGEADVEVSIRRSVHGPVVPLADGRLVAVRTAMDDSFGGWMTAWKDLGRARDLPTFERTLARTELPMFTVVYADRDGHILYLSAGRVPERLGHAEKGWFEPVRGDASSMIWTKLHGYPALPHIVDPRGGFVQNANSVPWFATYPDTLDPARYAALGIPAGPLHTREIHALRLLTADTSITFDELRTMQQSARLELADHVLPDLLAAARSDPTLAEAVKVLEAWDREASSPGAVLFEAWAGRAMPKLAFAVPWSAADPLDTPRGIADPASAVAELRAATTAVQQRWGSLAPAWGDVHVLKDGVPGVGASGGLGSFRVIDWAPGEDGVARPVAGDTFVALVELRPEGPRAEVLLTYGNSSPSAPFARDQLELLSGGKMRTPLLQRAEIEAAAVESLRVP